MSPDLFSLPPAFVSRVRTELPGEVWSEDPDDRAFYGRDWTKVFPPRPSAVARPRSTAEVAQLVRLCREFRVPVTPSGGRTGLAGGAVAARGELVLSLDRMRRMDPVDLLGGTVRVQAGAITSAVHAHAAEAGLTWPVDFASKGSSQIGGNIATNAGGVRVIRWGLTRQWVLGLEVVTGTGEVLDIGGALEKNNTGIDLRQLFIGSEGTLGIITEATLKLARPASSSDVFLFAVPDLAGVLRLFRAARGGPFTLGAFEFWTDRCQSRVTEHRRLRPPFETEATHFVLVEAERTGGDGLDVWLESLFTEGVVLDGLQAQNTAQAEQFWALRESISESLSATGLPHKNDVALPIHALEDFCTELEGLIHTRYPAYELCLFGHVGDGNIHINVMKPADLAPAEFHARTHALDHDLFRVVQRHGGSISAEHGIGLLKRDFLGYSRSAGEIAVMRAIKRVLDPDGILNPGKVFDLQP